MTFDAYANRVLSPYFVVLSVFVSFCRYAERFCRPCARLCGLGAPGCEVGPGEGLARDWGASFGAGLAAGAQFVNERASPRSPRPSGHSTKPDCTDRDDGECCHGTNCRCVYTPFADAGHRAPMAPSAPFTIAPTAGWSKSPRLLSDHCPLAQHRWTTPMSAPSVFS